MKASELIEEIQMFVKQWGDKEVCLNVANAKPIGVTGLGVWVYKDDGVYFEVSCDPDNLNGG